MLGCVDHRLGLKFVALFLAQPSLDLCLNLQKNLCLHFNCSLIGVKLSLYFLFFDRYFIFFLKFITRKNKSPFSFLFWFMDQGGY